MIVTPCCRRPTSRYLPAEQRRQLAVAVTDVEDDGLRRVLLGVRDQEVQQEALAAARRAEDERVADVLDVEVERVRRPVGRLERRERLPSQMRDSPRRRDPA